MTKEEQELTALFLKYCEGTEQDKAEVNAILRSPESAHLLYSDTFLRVAKRWAETLGTIKIADDEPGTCPCCGQEMEN
jgi:hypothetical protein